MYSADMLLFHVIVYRDKQSNAYMVPINFRHSIAAAESFIILLEIHERRGLTTRWAAVTLSANDS